MKIAYFTPISPQRTGIADYSELELIPYLAKYADIDLFIDDGISPSNDYIKENFNIYSYKDYDKRNSLYDVALYHMGSNHFHKFIYETLIKNPGITVLHDIYLYGFLYYYCLVGGDINRFKEEFRYCYGAKGAELAAKSLRNEISPEYKYTLTKRVLDNSLGVICHSEFGIRMILEEGNDLSIVKIDQPYTISDGMNQIRISNKDSLRTSLKLDKYKLVISSFGFIFNYKRYHILLKVFKKFLKYCNVDIILLLIGEDGMGLNKLISELGLSNSVAITGYVPHHKVLEYLAASDFCVNLRYPTAGETSRSVLQIMAMGKAVIVSNTGWFTEIPQNCCLKVDVDENEEEMLFEYFKLLASDESLRDFIGREAYNYVLKRHDPRMIAKNYYKYIKNILNGNELVLQKISSEMTSMGVDEKDEGIIAHISGAIQEILEP